MQVIRNGNVLIDGQLKKVDVLFDEKEILDIREKIECDCPEVDASGCVVLPGFVDVHVHLREPGFTKKETIHTGTKQLPMVVLPASSVCLMSFRIQTMSRLWKII